MRKKRLIMAVAIVLIIWFSLFITDFIRVAGMEKNPLFAFTFSDESHYTGAGYSYDIYRHPITGRYEYALYLFGIPVTSNFTN
ncbi:MAG: hypothetical protein K6E62_06485 [Lachnospiraceae bacterium]|nr:hypothetical protein [Lachnospiraceae bacterium]